MESETSKQNNPPSARPGVPALPPWLMPGSTPEIKPRGFGVRDILTVLFKHKFKIVIMFLLAVIAAPFVYFLIPKTYEAVSLLMIKSGREYASPNLNNEPTPLRVGLNEVIQTEFSILRSRDLAVRVIKAVGLAALFPKLEGMPEPADVPEIAVLAFQRSLAIDTGKNSNILRVSFLHENPQVAARVVNKLIDIYKEKRLEILNDNNSIVLIEQKVAEYRDKLKAATGSLESFKQKYGVFAFDEQRNFFLQQRMNLETTLTTAQTEVKELRQKVASLENQLKAVPQNVLVPDGVDRSSGAELKLMELLIREQELLRKYKEDSTMVKSVRNEIRMANEFVDKLKARGGMGSNSFYRDIQKEILTTQANLSSSEVKVTEVTSQLEQADKRLHELDRQGNAFKDLQLEIATYQQNYQTYLKKREEAKISDDMDRQNMTSINVIEKAAPPLMPVSPKKGLLFFVAAAAALGGGGGLGLSFLLENMKQGLSSPQQAGKRLDIPVLTTVNYQKNRS